MTGPLKSVRVLDLTSVVMGPYATQILGDYGADVVKIESPEGDIMRLAGPMKNPKMGHLYMSTNRSKRSVVIDLKTAGGRQLLLNMVADFDIFVYNIRPQAMARLGLSYEDVAKVNSKIIYVGAFGFSQRGPYAASPAYDDLIQGMAGVPWLSKEAGCEEPRYTPFVFADRAIGMQVATATLAALYHREKTGRGQRVDVPMFEGLTSILLGEHLAGGMFNPPEGQTGYQRSLSKNRKPYRTLDGYLCIFLYTDKHWQSFFTAIGQIKIFQSDPKFSSQANRLAAIDDVYGYLADILVTRSTADWMDLFEDADIPVAPMNSIDDVLDDEHLQAIGFFKIRDHPSEGQIVEMAVSTEWSDSPPIILRHAPQLGEQTREVLREAGMTMAEIRQLEVQGIIGGAQE